MAIERALVSGSMAMLVMKLLSEKDMYGYEMIDTLRQKSQNVFELKAGTLYPLLHSLEEKGLLTVYEQDVAGKTRKYYSLTRQGRGFLEKKIEEWKEYSAAVTNVLVMEVCVIDEYLNLLLEHIRCTYARPYIKQELQDHMEDQIAENMKAGMDHEQAEKEAVRDMGDPVETGISLDSIHRPQAAWKLLGIIIFISIAGVLIHAGISRKASENAVAGSDRYVFHVMIGLAVMMILYLLDYTVLAKFSKIIAAVLLAVCLLVILEGGQVNGARIFISLPGGRRGMDVQKLMLFYVPIYGAILYKYHGWGYKGLIRAILWLIAPVILVYSLPALRTACVMLVTMLTMLTIAIKKDWFTVRKKRTICGIWAVFLTAPIAAFLSMYLRNRLAEYQIARIQAMFSSGSETDYLTKMLHSLWRQNKLIGKSKSDVTGILPAFNADYILTYLSSVYGIIAAILLCCVLAVLIFAVFNTALRQKNQLGMMMGCGCGIVFLISFLINVLENLGVFPQSITFLPFFSAGGSCIIISYGLMGIVLSTYRYKNIYPRHPETGFMSINSKVKKVS